MLNAVLDPVTQAVFFRDYWTKSFLHLPGAASKFSHLFSWKVLNGLLEEHQFDEKRVRLSRSGKRIEASRYLRGKTVNSAGLIDELASGATVILSECEEVYRPLRDLCEQLESLLHQKTTAFAVAGWRRDNGFAVHWDIPDVLILQIAGRKRWKIWEPTRRFPFKKDVVDTSRAPSGDPFWEGVLEVGGLLSVPRGWWHAAYPLDEPCLHLSISVQSHNGIDLLQWLADSLKTSEVARMPLPVLATDEERDAWVAMVRAALIASFDDKLVSRFLSGKDAGALPRPVLSLPEDVSKSVRLKTAPVNGNTLLELAVPGPIEIAIRNGKARCEANGERWEVDGAVGERLLKFNDRLPHSLAELSSPTDPHVSFAVGMLLMHGLLRRTN
jgi:ribosomal protein L16 Arg81 hydroxylase